MNFIVIEGLDGAGKSTQIKLLQEYYRSINIKSEHIHFPRTDAPYFGELIAKFLKGDFGNLDEVNPYLVAMIYAGDQRDASVQIREWLNSGKAVILDRYVYSNIAYQCAKLSSKEEKDRLAKWIKELEFNHFSLPKPDLNIFLDVPAKFTELKLNGSRKGADRDYLEGGNDIHESSITFQSKVREIYLSTALSDESFKVINCSAGDGSMLPPLDISQKIIRLISDFGIIT